MELGGLDDDASVALAEPFETEGVRPVPRRGQAEFVEAHDFVHRDVEDFDFLRSGDVADPAALSEIRRVAGHRERLRIFESQGAAGEVGRAIAAQVQDQRLGDAREPDAAGHATAHGVVEFSAEDVFVKAPDHAAIMVRAGHF